MDGGRVGWCPPVGKTLNPLDCHLSKKPKFRIRITNTQVEIEGRGGLVSGAQVNARFSLAPCECE